jgi:hypothetical protein
MSRDSRKCEDFELEDEEEPSIQVPQSKVTHKGVFREKNKNVS